MELSCGTAVSSEHESACDLHAMSVVERLFWSSPSSTSSCAESGCSALRRYVDAGVGASRKAAMSP